MRKIILIIAAAAFPTVGMAAYKCQNGGQTVYSDAPCGHVVGTVKDSPSPDMADQFRAQAELGRMRQQNQFDRDIVDHKVRIGMSAQQVVSSWGAPTKINETVTGSGTRQQWVYRRGVAAQYVYVENGHVTAISSN